ncbi:uncharacterized protein A4U43_C09F14320 [Asparagus officinalis]|uniref:S1 motif domain-containing protein n=1 Tax=Asparagus officinalis TaxID=4686 RepID=A0A5P1E7X4_ASPOF|nr:uncharacterized protein A4U43_C09F14320 [Asparagus officinalis]
MSFAVWKDHLGDMDFKIAGTRKGVTAIQLDIKPAGIPLDVICESLEPAGKQILNRTEQEISAPPVMDEVLHTYVGYFTYEYASYIVSSVGARIAISDGMATIVASNRSVLEKAQENIDFLVGREIEVGKIYKGVIISVNEYGAFVDLGGGQQGLLHISELSHDQNDIKGNIKLSSKAILKGGGSKKTNSEYQGSIFPAKPATSVFTSEEGLDEAPTNKDQSEDDDSLITSTPSFLIRGSSECDSQNTSSEKKIVPRSGKGAN